METVVSAAAGACAVVGGPASLPCASSTSVDSWAAYGSLGRRGAHRPIKGLISNRALTSFSGS